MCNNMRFLYSKKQNKIKLNTTRSAKIKINRNETRLLLIREMHSRRYRFDEHSSNQWYIRGCIG